MSKTVFEKHILCPSCDGNGFHIVDHELTKKECGLCKGQSSILVDSLHDEAVKAVAEITILCVSSLQRKLKIGYNRATYIMEDLEKLGIVSASKENGRRELLIESSTQENMQ